MTVATVGIAAAIAATAAVACPSIANAQQSGCSDVQIIFARGSGEFPGVGILGGPFSSALTGALPGRSVDTYAVNYAASVSQLSASQGGNDITRKVTEVASVCPATRFVLGGYSQGATAVAISLGIRTVFGSGNAIPASVAPSIAAIVTFGDPLGARRQSIAGQSPVYADRAKTYCATGDVVCGGGFNPVAHFTYAFNGDIGDAASFAAGKIDATTAVAPPATGNTPPVSTPPLTVPTPTSPFGNPPFGDLPFGDVPFGFPFGSQPGSGPGSGTGVGSLLGASPTGS